MSGPRRYLIRMIVFLVAVVALAVALSGRLVEIFSVNPELSSLILGIEILGIVYTFRQVFLLAAETAWLNNFRTNRPGLSTQAPPRLLAPMAAMLGERKGRISISAISARSVLDGIGARLDESRDLSRYLIGLLIFLGLLGTFWGLLKTIGAVADVIGGLSVTGTDLTQVFSDLKKGLAAPLNGMGTAFSSSLFGLSGSLVLGFLELQTSQAQNRFFNDLEDWLAGQTRLSSGLGIGEGGDQPVPAYVQALLEQTADGLEHLQRTLERGEEARISANQSIVQLGDKIGTLTDQMRTEQSLMMKLAEIQMEIKPILAKLAEGPARAGIGMDDQMRTNVRSIDMQMARLLEEISSGRAEMVSELRTEIRVLSRTLAAIAEKARR
jgi:hypothetical protein